MDHSNESSKDKLARLQDELKDLKSLRTEHCSGTQEFMATHQTSIEHWQKIEDIEDEIKQLKAE